MKQIRIELFTNIKFFKIKLIGYIFFLFYPVILFSQSEALQYPRWVYNPPEAKGMVSAIAFATGSSSAEATINAKQKAKNEMYRLLQLTIVEITAASDTMYLVRDWPGDFPNSLFSGLSTEIDKSVTRDVYIEKKGDVYKTIILIDYPIKDFKEYILSHIESNKLLKDELVKFKLYKDLKRRLRSVKPYIVAANQKKSMMESLGE